MQIIKYKNLDWVVFDFSKINTAIYPFEGVYMIDEVYIGQSTNLLNRISEHIKLSKQLNHGNISLQEYINNMLLNKNPINVKFLSDDILDEGFLIKEHKPIFNNCPGRKQKKGHPKYYKK